MLTLSPNLLFKGGEGKELYFYYMVTWITFFFFFKFTLVLNTFSLNPLSRYVFNAYCFTKQKWRERENEGMLFVEPSFSFCDKNFSSQKKKEIVHLLRNRKCVCITAMQCPKMNYGAKGEKKKSFRNLARLSNGNIKYNNTVIM